MRARLPYRVGVVTDNLIHRGEMPPTVGVFVDLGEPDSRNAEYDPFDSVYATSGRLYVTNAVAILADIGTSQPVRVPVVDRYFLRAFPREVKVMSVSAIDGDGKVVAKSP